LFDTTNPDRPTETLRAPTDKIGRLQDRSPDSARIAVGGLIRGVPGFIDDVTQKRWEAIGEVRSLRWLPDGRRLLALRNDTIVLVDPGTKMRDVYSEQVRRRSAIFRSRETASASISLCGPTSRILAGSSPARRLGPATFATLAVQDDDERNQSRTGQGECARLWNGSIVNGKAQVRSKKRLCACVANRYDTRKSETRAVLLAA
jgi:hypothetical protein